MTNLTPAEQANKLNLNIFKLTDTQRDYVESIVKGLGSGLAMTDYAARLIKSIYEEVFPDAKA